MQSPVSAKSAIKTDFYSAIARFQPRWRDMLLIMVVAFAYRGLYLYEATQRPAFHLLYLDEEYHVDWAKALVSGQWTPPYDVMKEAPFFRAPLYPYWLAAMIGILGEHLVLIRVVQAAIGSISCGLAYSLATRCFGRPVGLVTGLLCALYWVLVYFDGELVMPAMEVFFALLGFHYLFKGTEKTSAICLTLSGLCFGLFAITRPNILIFLPLAIWWVARWALQRKEAGSRLLAVAFAVACILPPALVTLRNRVVGGDWVVVASQGGVNFYIGNNPDSDRLQAVVPGTHHTWWGGFNDTVAIAERAAGRKLKPSEVSNYWFGRAFDYIQNEPGRWLAFTFTKAFLLLDDVELPNNKPYEARRWSLYSLRWNPLGFAVIFALFLIAMPGFLSTQVENVALSPDRVLLQQQWRSLLLQFIIVYALTIVAFFVCGRYRVTLVPFVAIGAAVGMVNLYRLARNRHTTAVLIRLMVAILVAGILKLDLIDTRPAIVHTAKLSDAQDCWATGDLQGAITRFEKIRAERFWQIPEVYIGLIGVYLEQKASNYKQTIGTLAQEGVSLYPDEPELLWHLIRWQAESRQYDELRKNVDRYSALQPRDPRALSIAFGVALQVRRLDDARQYLARVESLGALDKMVRQMRTALDRTASSVKATSAAS